MLSIIGLPVAVIALSRGVYPLSRLATLYAGHPIDSKKSTANGLNGELNASIPRAAAYSRYGSSFGMATVVTAGTAPTNGLRLKYAVSAAPSAI